MGHKVKVNGTVYEVKGGKTKVDGTAYSIKGGKTKIGGTGYSISFLSPPSSHTPGDIITWDNKEWLVCHYDSGQNRVYLISKDVVSTSIFGSSKNYLGSTLAQVAANYQANSMSAEALEMCVDVTVPNQGASTDVTAKVFVPSYDQMYGASGGFGWFYDNNARRIAQYNGSDHGYWTCSGYLNKSMFIVNRYGRLTASLDYDQSTGFRPCVCVQL